MKIEYKTAYGVQGDRIVEVQTRRVKEDGEDGWVVKQGCFLSFVEAEKLSETRQGAEERLRRLNTEEQP